MPRNEAERRKMWLTFPREARAAIRKLHSQIGHKPLNVLLHILKGAKASPEVIKAAKYYKCDVCTELDTGPRPRPTKAPSRYAFNHELIIDVIDVKDSQGERYSFLSMVDAGTTFHQVALVRVGGGNPSSRKCLSKLITYWTSWAGWPSILTCDRGTHNRGALAKACRANGTYIRPVGVEAPEQIGRGERHGGVWKKDLKHVVKEHNVTGKEQMKIAASVAIETKNNFLRVGGFSPSQWVLGKSPRGVGRAISDEDEIGMLGVLEDAQDGTTLFGLQAQYRLSAQKAFIHMDCSRRFAASQLRKAVPLPGPYKVGDYVCYKQEQHTDGSPGSQWSGVSRILGFDGDVVIAMHQGVPVFTATHRLRPCSASEVLAHTMLADRGLDVIALRDDQQQGFIDATGPCAEIESGPSGAGGQAPAISDEQMPEQEAEPAPAVPAELEYEPTSPAEDDDDEQIQEPPMSRRRIEEALIEERNQGDETPDAEPEAEDMTPLERAWQRETAARPPDAGQRLLRAIANRSGSAASTASGRDRSRSPHDHAEAFMADTVVLDKLEAVSKEVEKAVQDFTEYKAFLAERFETKASEAWRKGFRKSKGNAKRNKQKSGKLYVYRKENETIRKGIDGSRTVEWKKWKHFSAVTRIPKAEGDQMVAEGVELIPTDWVDNDKNARLRTAENPIEIKHKSRLVARGDIEKYESRSDSPTVSEEGQALIFSFASSRELPIKSRDISNAYFQGQKLVRKLLLKQPPGGLVQYDEDDGLLPDDYLLANVPIYGTRDAGRGLWKKLRNTFRAHGFKENRIIKALYSIVDENNRVVAMVGTHVDDILWACEPEVDHIVEASMAEFECGSDDIYNFTYCGIEVKQNEETFDIEITCEATTKQLQPIRIAPGRAKQVFDNVTKDEEEQLRSVVGSLAWVARRCRPDLRYRVSRLQTRANKATVMDLKECNKVVAYAVATPEIGITYKSDGLDWDRAVMVSVTDASYANEEEYIEAIKNYEPFRSQSGRMHVLANPEILKGERVTVHIISHTSQIIPRVCRATLQSEAYSMSYGVENADILRAAIADCHGKLDLRNWETSAAAHMQQIWVTDCESLVGALGRPVMAKLADKRLQVEVAALRQQLWRKMGEEAEDPLYVDKKPGDSECSDLVVWVDTDVMVADPLTKQMEPDLLRDIMKNGAWSIKQPIESQMKKRIKQGQRAMSKKEAQIANEDRLRVASGHKTKYEVNKWQKLETEHTCNEPPTSFKI